MSADECEINYEDYTDESVLEDIQVLVAKDLSEPYSIFTYRYFIHNWPSLCICVYASNKDKNKELKHEMIGVIVCKADGDEYADSMKGYIAMLTVSKSYRKKGIGLKVSLIMEFLFKETFP